MEIEKNQGVQIDAYVNQVHDKDKVDHSNKNSDKSAAKTDTVVISDAAKRIQEVRTQLNEIPDVREDKVAQLKNEIENGTYQIDAEKIAGKMIREGLINDGVKEPTLLQPTQQFEITKSRESPGIFFDPEMVFVSLTESTGTQRLINIADQTVSINSLGIV
jgi:negative regulator of flagellin synthesis FlgM